MTNLESGADNDTGEFESLSAVYARTENYIRQAITSDGFTLVESPPSSGKTTSTFKIASELDETVVYLTKREDLYDQAVDKCESHGCSHEIIPSPYRDCPSFDRDSPSFEPEAHSLYQLGVGASQLHHRLNLNCGPNCNYMQKWDSFAKDADVIIGHYKHAYISSIVDGNIVVIDEFPGGAFEEEFDDADTVITKFLQNSQRMPYSDFQDLIANQDDYDKTQTAYAWFRRNGVGPDADAVLNASKNNRYHALAPFLIFTILNTLNEKNGFDIPWFNVAGFDVGFDKDSKFAGMEQDRRAVMDRQSGSMHVLTPPNLSEAKSVVGLDGTPTAEMWEIATNETLDILTVLNQSEMTGYVRDILGITVKKTSEYLKPYHGGQVSENRDEAVLYGVEIAEGEKAALITTDSALKQYNNTGVLDRVADSMNYAEVLSSNAFKGQEVGVIMGAPHPGDGVLKRWAGYCAKPIEGEGRGMEKSYGDFGDEVYHHFVHNQVLQAILRFGRGKSNATVYVNTAAIPEDYIAIDSVVNPKLFNSPNKREIADHLRSVGSSTKSKLESVTGASKTTVEDILYDFRDADYVEEKAQAGPYPSEYTWLA